MGGRAFPGLRPPHGRRLVRGDPGCETWGTRRGSRCGVLVICIAEWRSGLVQGSVSYLQCGVAAALQLGFWGRAISIPNRTP